ncbi:MAG: TonB-dependent receptor, partial [Polyangiaceae bacterium]
QPLGGRPPHTLTASLALTVCCDVEIYARFRASSDAFVDRTIRAPAYQTLDLRVSRPLWSGAQAYIGVVNLTDVHQEPGRVGDLRSPMGRVLYAGLRAELPGEDR